MMKIKLFEQFVNENLFEDRMCETYFWLRVQNPELEDDVTDYVLKEFGVDADELGEALSRWLDNEEFEGNADGFVKNPPDWFVKNMEDGKAPAEARSYVPR